MNRREFLKVAAAAGMLPVFNIGCELVAVCEPDPNAMTNFWAKAAQSWTKEALAAARVYADYRVMFDEVGDTLDAVFVATPNHHHALPTLLAIRHGANVFVEYSDRPNTMFHRPPSCPPPKGMDWDLWCGGSPVCENYAGEEGRVGLHPGAWQARETIDFTIPARPGWEVA